MEPWPHCPTDQRAFAKILDHLRTSQYALAVLCSVSTQMKLLPAAAELPGLADLHRENYETGYHRLTAEGCVRRILAGDDHPTVVGIALRCMAEAAEHDRRARDAIGRMAAAAGNDEARRWVTAVQAWQERTSAELQIALTRAREVVGEACWKFALQLQY
ncbi:MAG: hypothetical protein QJR06_00340 [Alicyclobacillaceae bacterium]|nr:hypothetical protein [Alicyclobacillaceae bacterium]